MCLGTLVTQRLCSEGTKRFIRDCFVLRGHTETYQRFTVLRGHWYIIALRAHSGISAGIPFGQPQVVVDWETVIQRPSFFPSTLLSTLGSAGSGIQCKHHQSAGADCKARPIMSVSQE